MTVSQTGPAVERAPAGPAGGGQATAGRGVRWRALVQSAGFCAAAICALALLGRLLFMSVPLDIDEGMWIRRGPLFIVALLRGDWAGTYLRHHPGVTNMWITGAALSLRYALRALLPGGNSGDLASYLSSIAQATPGAPLWAYVTARTASAVVTAGCLAGIYLLGRRLFGRAVALLAVAILLFEPFFLAYQRSITTDANQTNFTWLALLAFLLYGRAFLAGRRRLPWLVLAGVCYGLAGLSKISALLSLPAFSLWAGWLAWSRRSRNAWLRLAGDLILWGVLAIGVAFLLWPALWQNLPGTLARMVTDLGEEIDGHYQFFLGQTSLAPGAGFYPVVLLYRLSPLLLLGSLWGLVSLVWPRLRRYVPDHPAMYIVLVDVLVVLLALASRASKIDRYIIPVVPGLALLTAGGIWATVQAWRAGRAGQVTTDTAADNGSQRCLGLTLGVVVLAQLAVCLPHYPVLLTYFNPLLGGPARARQALMVGNGELLDRAAAWLNAQPGAGQATAASWYSGSFAPYYEGQTVELIRDPASGNWPLAGAQYAVLYINQFQRQQPPEVTRYFGPQRPLYTVQAHGTDYARVYAGPAVAGGQLPPGGQPANLDFGPYARLIGYELQTPEVASGDTAVLVLYWQPQAAFPTSDYSVYLGVRRDDGQIFGKADNAPVGGMVPVDQWRPGQVIRDAQQVRILSGTPPGEYALDVGLYSAQLGQALPIKADGAPAGSRVPLTRLRVTRPAPPQARADPGIAHALPPETAPRVGATRLAGYEWAAADRLQAGAAAPVTLLWQAIGASAVGATDQPQIFLNLSDGSQSWQRALGHPLGGDYPAGKWTPGELVRDSWSALLPANVPAGRYQLSLIAKEGGRTIPLVDLGSVELQTRSRVTTPPQPTSVQVAELGGLARLVGYDLPKVIDGKTLPLKLYWQAAGEADRNYVRFVHLLGPDDKIVAQVDGPPGGNSMPMTGWVAGEYITDTGQLDLPASLPTGAYHIALGLYDPATGKRLATPDGTDRILLEQPLLIPGMTP
jgi:4-amino-4-deoxy-L-arabinose transferase-like glycosyltransferase